MSNLSNTMGDGGAGGRESGTFSDTGYGTHDGQGNVPTGAPYEKGTGYDEHGQVATSFGKWPLSYDPVTGMAAENVTTGYDFPAGGRPAGALVASDVGGLVDVSAPAPGHAAGASPEIQRQVQDFFDRRSQQRAVAMPAVSTGGEGQRLEEARTGAGGAGAEASGQGVAERMDAGAYLPRQPELTGQEAEAWRDRRYRDPENVGLERPPATMHTGGAQHPTNPNA